MRRRAAARLLRVALASLALAGAAALTETARTHPDDVAALLALDAALRDPSARLASWTPASDPCGRAPDCGVGACAWAGVGCAAHRIVSLNLSCSLPECGGHRLGSPRPPQAPLKGGQKALAIALTDLDALAALDLSGNALAGALPAGPLPRGLAVLDLSDNANIHGALPPAWGGSHSLRVLDLGGTHVAGTIPPAWADLAVTLRAVSFRDACGVCGTPPWSDVPVDGRGSNVGGTCGSFICAPAPASVALQIAAGVAVAVGVVAACAIRRGVRPYDAATRGPPRGMWAMHAALFGTTAPRERPIELRASGEGGGSEAAAAAAAAGAKRPPPCLVVGPDGATVSYGLRLTPLPPLDDDGALSDGGGPRRRCASPVGRRGDVELGLRREP